MKTAFDQSWADDVCRLCDPVFESADVGFVRQTAHDPGSGIITSLLWEADPVRFAERYPDSDVIESYGPDDWPPHCIDYWVYVDANARQAHISTEGWSSRDEILDLSGDGVHDGLAIGSAMARILRVPPPG